VELGLHLSDFTWPGDSMSIAGTLAQMARTAEEVGFRRLTVMDHVWQIPRIGPAEHAMLECYTTLGYLAAVTEHMSLGTLVTAASYRHPGLLAKIVSTLDLLSGGRAVIGLGAGWYAEEAAGLGLAFPPLGTRFEQLEETLQILQQMWAPAENPYAGKHYHLQRTLNSPQPLSSPRPRILIGGGGERKTLLLVARYADACNLNDTPELAQKLDVLRRHCDSIGRDYETVEKTANVPLSVAVAGAGADEFLQRLQILSKLGISAVYVSMRGPQAPATVQSMGTHIIPRLADW
jgi:F420-dependent oxidoreductase-like protein